MEAIRRSSVVSTASSTVRSFHRGPPGPLPRTQTRSISGGAILAEGVTNFAVDGCSFVDVGGNGVVISGYSRGSRLVNNTFARFGAAAMVVAGRSKLIDLTGGDFPKDTLIESNVAYDGGVSPGRYYRSTL